MCLIIHKPAQHEVPLALLISAAEFNPHGFGIVSLTADGGLRVQRRRHTDRRELERLYQANRDAECVLHFRYRTHGDVDLENTHPLRVTSSIYLLHNGTLRIEQPDSARSDTWHLVENYLRPILRRRPQLLHERSFSELLLAWAGPANRFVFVDSQARKTVIVNREAGMEVGALWLSNDRWFDATRVPWRRVPLAPAPARKLQFAL